MNKEVAYAILHNDKVSKNSKDNMPGLNNANMLTSKLNAILSDFNAIQMIIIDNTLKDLLYLLSFSYAAGDMEENPKLLSSHEICKIQDHEKVITTWKLRFFKEILPIVMNNDARLLRIMFRGLMRLVCAGCKYNPDKYRQSMVMGAKKTFLKVYSDINQIYKNLDWIDLIDQESLWVDNPIELLDSA